jgi:hypothetical protein
MKLSVIATAMSTALIFSPATVYADPVPTVAIQESFLMAQGITTMTGAWGTTIGTLGRACGACCGGQAGSGGAQPGGGGGGGSGSARAVAGAVMPAARIIAATPSFMTRNHYRLLSNAL